MLNYGMVDLTDDELVELVGELNQYPDDTDAQEQADYATTVLLGRGDFGDPDYGGN